MNKGKATLRQVEFLLDICKAYQIDLSFTQLSKLSKNEASFLISAVFKGNNVWVTQKLLQLKKTLP